MRGRRHPPEVKAAVLAALLSGQGVTHVAQEHHLSPGLVSSWKKELSSSQWQSISEKKLEDLSALVARYLNEILNGTTFLMEFIQGKRQSKWLEEQSAAEVATLLGVATDKGIRLLEAAEYTAAAGDSEPDQLEAASRPSDGSIQ